MAIAAIVTHALTPAPQPGPLALVAADPGTSDARTSGELEITDRCVRLRYPDGSDALLIWVDGAVAWQGADASITGAMADGEPITLRDGDHVSVGGAGGPIESVDSAGRWISRPSETCTAAEWFLVAEVVGQP